MVISKITKSPTPIELVKKVNELVVEANDNTLPIATNATLGCVKVGDGLNVASDGTVSSTIKENLNGKHPSWWLARGDGSLGDKVCTNGEIFEGIYNFQNFTVPAGVTVYINYFACILCNNSFINWGTINGEGRGALSDTIGFYGGSGGGGGVTSFESSPTAGSISSYNQGIRTYTGSPSALVVNTLMYLDNALTYGASGGRSDRASGGRGGAGLRVISDIFTNAGNIYLNGGNGTNGYYISPGKYCGGGGGGGGGVGLFIANTINTSGSITVNAGNGGSSGGDRSGWGSAGNPGIYKIISLGSF